MSEVDGFLLYCKIIINVLICILYVIFFGRAHCPLTNTPPNGAPSTYGTIIFMNLLK